MAECSHHMDKPAKGTKFSGLESLISETEFKVDEFNEESGMLEPVFDLDLCLA